jgi:hypothetical protein
MVLYSERTKKWFYSITTTRLLQIKYHTINTTTYNILLQFARTLSKKVTKVELFMRRSHLSIRFTSVNRMTSSHMGFKNRVSTRRYNRPWVELDGGSVMQICLFYQFKAQIRMIIVAYALCNGNGGPFRVQLILRAFLEGHHSMRALSQNFLLCIITASYQ